MIMLCRARDHQQVGGSRQQTGRDALIHPVCQGRTKTASVGRSKSTSAGRVVLASARAGHVTDAVAWNPLRANSRHPRTDLPQPPGDIEVVRFLVGSLLLAAGVVLSGDAFNLGRGS